MNRPLVGLFLFAFVLGGCPSLSPPPLPPAPPTGGGEESGETGGEAPVGCEEDADCPAPNGLCEVASCEDAQCGSKPAEEGAECTDGDACTDEDSCVEGLCTGGVSVECDDGNACTNDECDSLSGCKHVNHKDACDDGDICTTNDACDGGECLGSPSGECTCEADADCAEHEDGDLCNGTLICSEELNCVVDVATKVDCSSSGGACADAVCDPSTGECLVTNLEEGLECNDFNSCTVNDLCVDGTCAGDLIEGCGCASDADCSDLDDELFCNGIMRCIDALCVIDVDSIPSCEGDDGNPCTVNACDEVSQACAVQPGNTGDVCEDGDVCTTESKCAAGECTAVSLQNCDDDNSCTDDDCDPVEGCQHLENELPCEDGDVCTEGDACLEGACIPGPLNECEDGNACTDDPCDSVDGCDHVDNENACDDGSQCTVGDYCGGGLCNSGLETLPCDDGNACTSDSCDGLEGCVHVAVAGAPCSDDDLCTDLDLCDAQGLCISGGAVECEDGNACTLVNCAPETGCLPGEAIPGAECDDGNVCTSGDLCNDEGVCLAGDAVSCDDGNVCTTDLCQVNDDEGCTHEPNSQACSDGNECTENDFCESATCVSGTTKLCSDENPCTSAQCDPVEGCQSIALVGKSCEDGDALCTLSDACNELGECASGSPPLCDDGDVCTTDLCKLNEGCIVESAPSGTLCEDGNPCTDGDNCFGGVCKPGQNSICECQQDSDCPPSDNQCNGQIICNTTQGLGPANTCQTDPATVPPPCDPSEGSACFVNTCVPESGACQLQVTTSGTPCDDDDACTTSDQCAGGQCFGGPVTCVDGQSCTSDGCDSALGCQFQALTGDSCTDGTVCTESDVCVNGTCAGTPVVCDDENECTADACDAVLGCSNGLLQGSACEDGNPCTLVASCDETATCVGSGVEPCDDGTPCTLDSCDSAVSGGCVNTAQSGDCTDGDPCTLDDACQGGVCTPGPDLECGDDGNVCTGIACVAGEGCITSVLSGNACADGNACTEEDTCQGDASCIGIQLDCDDQDLCTFDNCELSGGCVYTDVSDVPGCPFYDGDGDGVIETSDNCPGVFNPEQLDSDDDGTGDVCEVDPAPCNSVQDIQILQSGVDPTSLVYSCEVSCGGPNPVCQGQCMASEIGISVGCSLCHVELFTCTNTVCKEACESGVGCNECVDSFCKPAFSECSLLGAAPQGGNCPETTALYCDNQCWPLAWWLPKSGDGACDLALNCEAQVYDAGDCGVFVCDAGQIADCDGYCMPAQEALEKLDNDVCDPEFNCELFGADGSFCDENLCEESFTTDCAGICVDIFELEDEIGSGDCNGNYQCVKFNFDGGDCTESSLICDEEEVTQCDGQCIPFEEVLETYSNGECDLNFACSDWDHDGADCDGKCINDSDTDLLLNSTFVASDYQQLFQTCGSTECEGKAGNEMGVCMAQCFSGNLGYSVGCSACFVALVNCGQSSCSAECLVNEASCDACLDQNCHDAFNTCAGFTP